MNARMCLAVDAFGLANLINYSLYKFWGGTMKGYNLAPRKIWRRFVRDDFLFADDLWQFFFSIKTLNGVSDVRYQKYASHKPVTRWTETMFESFWINIQSWISLFFNHNRSAFNSLWWLNFLIGFWAIILIFLATETQSGGVYNLIPI